MSSVSALPNNFAWPAALKILILKTETLKAWPPGLETLTQLETLVFEVSSGEITLPEGFIRPPALKTLILNNPLLKNLSQTKDKPEGGVSSPKGSVPTTRGPAVENTTLIQHSPVSPKSSPLTWAAKLTAGVSGNSHYDRGQGRNPSYGSSSSSAQQAASSSSSALSSRGRGNSSRGSGYSSRGNSRADEAAGWRKKTEEDD